MFDGTNIYLWISIDEKDSDYPGMKLNTVINVSQKDLYVVDFDRKTNEGGWLNTYKNYCGAYVETDKGFHFMVDRSMGTNFTQQDPKYLAICNKKGYWSQLIKSKKTGERRVMICSHSAWRSFVDKWNNIVEDYLTRGGK